MHALARLAIVVAAVAVLPARPARAVDISGTWSVCLSGGNGFCSPPTYTGSLKSAGGLYTLTITDQALACVVTGAVDPTTGELSVDPSGCAFFAGMTATATDTSITGSFGLAFCGIYTLTGVKTCGACDDGSPCTVDGCGATACSAPGSACTYVGIDGGSCSDGNACTAADGCHDGVCVGFPILCNDHNPCTNDACDSGTGLCVFTPNSNPCSDGNPCTTSDTCGGGACVGGPPPTCAPCERCGPFVGCVTGPRDGCRQPVTPAKAKLLLRDAPNDASDRVTWTWGAGAATSTTDLGDPVGSDGYTLCVFDGPPTTPRLMLESHAPSGGTCALGTSCWSAKGSPPGAKGFQYEDSGLLVPDGLKLVRLTPGVAGRAKAKVKGQGPNLTLPSPMNVTPPVIVQLQGEHGSCFGATYTAAQVDREDLFKAVGSP